MNRGECPVGSVQGFPIRIDNNPFTTVATSTDSWKFYKAVAKPLDFSVNWSTSSTPWTVEISRSSDSATRMNRFFYVGGFNTIATGTTITYEGVSYTCDSAFAICNAQHSNLMYPAINKAEYPFEVILSFQNTNPSNNPTAPNVILLCRPFKFGEANIPGWSDIEKAVTSTTSPTTYFHPKSLFMLGDDLVPSMAYETCINARLGRDPSSLRIRVCTAMTPLVIPTSANINAKCSDIARYRLRLNGGALLGGSPSTAIYIKQSTGGAYPSIPASGQLESNLFTIQSDTIVTDPVTTLQILVPSSFFGQDPAAIFDLRRSEERATGTNQEGNRPHR